MADKNTVEVEEELKKLQYAVGTLKQPIADIGTHLTAV